VSSCACLYVAYIFQYMEDQNAMVNLMLTKLMKIQHGIRAGFSQNSLTTGRKIVRFTTLLQFVVAQDLNLVKLVEQTIGGR
jgi:hypothetical protein